MPCEAPLLIAGTKPGFGAYDADIVILCLERPEETRAAIRSALAQRGGVFHVSVLDQNSGPDTTRALTTEFANTPHFSLYRAAQNLGVGGGRNFLAGCGHGRIIVGLDNDAVFRDPWIVAGAVEAFNRRPDLGALGFNILAADGSAPDLSSWGYPQRLRPKFREKFDATTFVGAGHAIRRATWQAVGGYDPSLFFTWEEYDFCLAAIARRWRIAYDGSLAVRHRPAPAARLGGDARMTWHVRNRLVISRKWGASWPALAPRILSYALRGAITGRLPATIQGIAAAWRAEIPPPGKMPKAMRAYIRTHESRHRGSWLDRLWLEVFKRKEGYFL
ncbi:glycosyltransferase family 2 protein [Acidocella sp.]|jgi:GT2 family glycosyltransferase|uniref:glycosyltransferase family 2 protein n=1 Tax=Acidocella sp. TaxID=50710 RepID=UPI002F416B27